MLAHAILAVTAAIEHDLAPAPAGLIELTVNEFRRLFDALILGAGQPPIQRLLAWSRRRRRHQHRARECHYRRRKITNRAAVLWKKGRRFSTVAFCSTVLSALPL
jgi:hypothetical protein